MTDKKSWSREGTFSLISHWELYPELWDVKSKHNKNRIMKQKALKTIATALNTSENEISRKLHNLRTQFHGEIRKIKPKHSGDGMEDKYESTWDFFEAMKFIQADHSNKEVLHSPGNLEIIQYLLEQYPEVSVDDIDPVTKKSPLYIATEKNHIQVMKYLLSKGADVRGYNMKNEETALHIASALGSLEMVNLLLENNAKVNVYNIGKESPLHKAITNGHSNVAKVLIRAGTRLNDTKDFSNSYLYCAIEVGMIEVVKELIQFGARIFKHEHLLVHLAIKKGSLKLVKILHRAGASSIRRVNDYRMTPLELACSLGRFSIAEYLLQNGLGGNSETLNMINNRLVVYCYQNVFDSHLYKKFLELFVKYNVNLEQSFNGINAFLSAINDDNFTAACMLIKYGFNVNCINEAWLKHCLRGIKGITTFSINEPSHELLKDFNNLIKVIICAGFNFKNVNIFKDLDDDISNFVAYSMSRPRSLKNLCRIKIRELLGQKIMINLYKLPLPKILHEYLALEIL